MGCTLAGFQLDYVAEIFGREASEVGIEAHVAVLTEILSEVVVEAVADALLFVGFAEKATAVESQQAQQVIQLALVQHAAFGEKGKCIFFM